MRHRHPLKWAKYLFLAQHMLTTSERLQSEIKRFSWEDRSEMIRSIAARLCRAKSNDEELLIVVKLVENDCVGALPNYRLATIEHVPDLELWIALQRARRYHEIWYCETQISREQLSVAGRIFFQDSFWEVAQRVEQVWRSSPRLIEEYKHFSTGGMPFTYARASRPSWGWRFRIEEMRGSNDATFSSHLEDELCASLVLIERQREKIDAFVEVLREAGATALSLEYKAEGNDLWFIDWDTAVDREILFKVRDGQ